MLRAVNMQLKFLRASHAAIAMTEKEREIQIAAENMIERYGRDALKEVDLRILELEARHRPQAVRLWREVRIRVARLVTNPGDDIKH